MNVYNMMHNDLQIETSRRDAAAMRESMVCRQSGERMMRGVMLGV